jgi:hypothetical protein
VIHSFRCKFLDYYPLRQSPSSFLREDEPGLRSDVLKKLNHCVTDGGPLQLFRSSERIMEPTDRISDLVLGSVGFIASVLLCAYQPLWSRYRFISSYSLSSLSLCYLGRFKSSQIRKFLGSFPYRKSANFVGLSVSKSHFRNFS